MKFGRWMAVAVAMAGLAAGAQDLQQPIQPLPHYEVATIRLAGKDSRNGVIMMRYLQQAFNVPAKVNVRVIGGPAWLATDEYVIQAKPSQQLRDAMAKMSADDRARENRLLEQGLLAERFHLKAHFEMREMQVFELVEAKVGVRMKEVNPPTARADGELPPIPPPDKFTAASLAGGTLAANVNPSTGATMLVGHAVPVRTLVNTMVNFPEVEGRPVIDKTGLKGTYDVKLDWATPLVGQAGVPDGGGISLFTALREQLGLDMVAKRIPVQVVIIDSIERPTEN